MIIVKKFLFYLIFIDHNFACNTNKGYIFFTEIMLCSTHVGPN